MFCLCELQKLFVAGLFLSTKYFRKLYLFSYRPAPEFREKKKPEQEKGQETEKADSSFLQKYELISVLYDAHPPQK